MYNNLFNVQDYGSDYVNTRSGKKPNNSHLGNIQHSQAIMSLLADLPYYEIISPQNLKKYGDPIGQNIILNIDVYKF